MTYGVSNGTNESMSIDGNSTSESAVSATVSHLVTAAMTSLTSSAVCMPLYNYVVCVVQFVIAVIGFAANLLSMIVFWPTANEMLSPMSFLLITLAVVDNGVLVFYTLLSTMPPICNYTNYCTYFTQVIYQYLTAYVWPIGTIFNMASVWIVAIVTLHRYIAVCHPHRVAKLASLRVARYQVVAISIGSVAFSIPRYNEEYAITLPDGTKSVVILRSLGENAAYQIVYRGVAYYFVIYVIPIAALIFMTYRLIVSLKKFYARREQVTSAGRAENDLTKTLVVVVVVFMICQVLNPIRRLLLALLPAQFMGCGSFYSIFYQLTALGIILDSSIHFFLYSVCDRRFRVRLRERFGSVFQLLGQARARIKPTATIQVPIVQSTTGAAPNQTGRRDFGVFRKTTGCTNASGDVEDFAAVHRIGLGASKVAPAEVRNDTLRSDGHEIAVISIG